MVKQFLKVSKFLMISVLSFQLMGCGTLLHPERKGQKEGRIDPSIAILDGIGLFFFIIPGLIAFAVDFDNGTIYLPKSGLFSSNQDLRQIKFDPRRATLSRIERVIQDETGQSVKLDQDNVKVSKLRSVDDMRLYFAQAVLDEQNTQVSLLDR